MKDDSDPFCHICKRTDETKNEFDSNNLCKLHTNPGGGWFSYSDSLKPGSKVRLGCFGLPYIQTLPGFERTCVRDTNPGNKLNYKWSPDISEVPKCIFNTDSECRSEVVRRGSQPFKASSFSSDNSPTNGRLYAKDGAWIPRKQEIGQWLEVNLGHSMDVYGVMTQGNYRKNSWVTLYKVAYREEDESPESIVNNENEEEAVFVGNVDRRTTSQQVFPEAVRARYVRIYPQYWYIQISLRFGVVACEVPTEDLACQVPQLENIIVYINSKRSLASSIDNQDTIVISCESGYILDNGDSFLSGECRNAEIVYKGPVASFACVKQADTSPSTSIVVEEDCGMPTINEYTIVNVNYRYDLDKFTPSNTKFPSGTILITRCYDIGKYQLINGGERVCSDGSWTGFPATCSKFHFCFFFVIVSASGFTA
ncbi:uncharacterized protein LOC117099957 [Anneissia japonica]|uniref:uncharacterized protein LOC117099957 n=1 Tax=Anneissia japonica TaxID=1529436 RepID=UPI001425B5A3|nr:uncharacterized protein LOC117099957 [Anneissia japonica]